ncbi:phage protease [Nonomuraea roseoviolacea]|uniref:Uncharacterized protein n=1 Tax=Nonomuraea roseoviolacea subsp. carminata TaxID=160689 RepID=A0ABT1K9B9_9ACTN|nr:phage protease [Nonomuraea roseoviolacea]MCP2350624.1 hypothetical protein [Nonomuraea roseoviolacea subsp. carminata]
MADIDVPRSPALVSIPGVELAQAGTWRLSSGEATITRDDLAAAVAALDCPAVRNPVLKLGHVDPRFDGEPAVGWVSGLRAADDGGTVVGDYRGMPAWLAEILASAYPDRSIEATRNFVCQIGHTHRMVITAVALLGVTAPGIGTLDSLQDVAALYDVAASSGAGGEPVTITIEGGGPMPPPTPELAAGVSSEDVRRRYYERAGYSDWICEIQLDPLQLIVMDDSTGGYYRVPVSMSGDDVEFGERVAVKVEYVDRPAKVAASALVFASREESIPEDLRPPASKAAPDIEVPAADENVAAEPQPGPPAEDGPTETPVTESPVGGQTKEDADMQFSDEQLADLRAKLGLPADADLDPAALLAGVEKLAASSGDGSPGTKSKNLPGTITVDRQVWDDQQKRIRKLEDIAASQQRTERERMVDDAIKAGKFAPSRRDHWLRLAEADPVGTATVLAGLTPGTIPVSDLGLPGGDSIDLDAEFAGLFPPEK